MAAEPIEKLHGRLLKFFGINLTTSRKSRQERKSSTMSNNDKIKNTDLAKLRECSSFPNPSRDAIQNTDASEMVLSNMLNALKCLVELENGKFIKVGT